MIINFKIFEKVENPVLKKAVDDFFNGFEEFKNNPYYSNSIGRAKNYNLPAFIFDEFALLDYLYKRRVWWSKDSMSDKNTKREVKKFALESILKKFEEDPDKYFELKKVLDNRPNFNNTGSFDGISDASVKYIFFLLRASINKAPEWITNTNNYNL